MRTGSPADRYAAERDALAANIAARGLINPIIVLNHRDPSQWERNWVMCGSNRLWCVRRLKWKTAPAVSTGPRPKGIACTEVAWEDIGKYFPDGTVGLGPHGPVMTTYSRFIKGEFPSESRR